MYSSVTKCINWIYTTATDSPRSHDWIIIFYDGMLPWWTTTRTIHGIIHLNQEKMVKSNKWYCSKLIIHTARTCCKKSGTAASLCTKCNMGLLLKRYIHYESTEYVDKKTQE